MINKTCYQTFKRYEEQLLKSLLYIPMILMRGIIYDNDYHTILYCCNCNKIILSGFNMMPYACSRCSKNICAECVNYIGNSFMELICKHCEPECSCLVEPKKIWYCGKCNVKNCQICIWICGCCNDPYCANCIKTHKYE